MDRGGLAFVLWKPLPQAKTSELLSQLLIDCEGYERIAKRSDAVAVAAGCDDDALPPVEGVGHRRCHGWNRERELLQFLTCRGVKDTQPEIFGAGCNNEARTGDDRAAKVSYARLLVGDHCSKRLLPHLG